MKNYKLIPLLAVAAFMTACNTNSASAKAPSFAKQGKEIAFEEFAEILSDKDLLGAWTDPENNHLPSAIVKASSSSSVESKITSGKKVVRSDKELSKTSYDMKLDLENLRIAVSVDDSTTNESQHEEHFSSYTSSNKMSAVEQISTLPVGNEGTETGDFLVEVNLTSKQYRVEDNVTDLNAQERKAMFEEDAYMIVSHLAIPSQFASFVSSYESMPLEERECFSFYQNGKILTMTYQSEYSTALVDSNNQVQKLTRVTYDQKFQLDYSKGESFKYKQSLVTTYSSDYLQDFIEDSAARYLGDTAEKVEAEYSESEVKAQKVKVDAINIDDFEELNGLI